MRQRLGGVLTAAVLVASACVIDEVRLRPGRRHRRPRSRRPRPRRRRRRPSADRIHLQGHAPTASGGKVVLAEWQFRPPSIPTTRDSDRHRGLGQHVRQPGRRHAGPEVRPRPGHERADHRQRRCRPERRRHGRDLRFSPGCCGPTASPSTATTSRPRGHGSWIRTTPVWQAGPPVGRTSPASTAAPARNASCTSARSTRAIWASSRRFFRPTTSPQSRSRTLRASSTR